MQHSAALKRRQEIGQLHGGTVEVSGTGAIYPARFACFRGLFVENVDVERIWSAC